MFETFIISLKDTGTGDHKLSAETWTANAQQCCYTHKWQFTIFPAINGYNLTNESWQNFGILPPAKKSSKLDHFSNLPGAQGCFLSHYLLWKKCITLNKPIIILEDDAEVTHPFEEIVTDKDLLKLHKPRQRKIHPKLGEWSPGAFGYLLFPTGAENLVKHVNTNGPMHADKAIASSIVNWGYIDRPVVKLGNRVGSSTKPNKYPYSLVGY